MLYMCGLGCSLYSMAFRGTVLAFDVYGFKLQTTLQPVSLELKHFFYYQKLDN